jgi:hypothetical protein
MFKSQFINAIKQISGHQGHDYKGGFLYYLCYYEKTSVALLCTISTKSKVGTEFMKPFEIEAHLPPAKKKGRCQTVLGTYD